MTQAVANRRNGKPGGGGDTAPLGSVERRYLDAIAWLDRLSGFYRFMNDDAMLRLFAVERDRLCRRMDAYTAIRLSSLKRSQLRHLDVGL